MDTPSSDTTIESLASLEQFVQSFRALPSARFLETASERFIHDMSAMYGEPLRAVAAIMPEVLQRQRPTIALFGRTWGLGQDGGRWMSLVSRLAPPPCQPRWLICTNRNTGTSGWKGILFQPPQRIVRQPWERFVAELDPAPDVLILYGLQDFDELWDVANSAALTQAAARMPVLWVSPFLPTLAIMSEILRERGIQCSPVHEIESPQSESAVYPGGFWIRIGAVPSDAVPPLPADRREFFSTAFSAFGRSAFEAVAMDINLSAHARVYATTAQVRVGEEDRAATWLLPDIGIDHASGRTVIRDYSSGLFVLGDNIVEPETLPLLPAPVTDPNDLAARFEMMRWIAVSRPRPGATVSAADITAAGETQAVASAEGQAVQETTSQPAAIADEPAPPAQPIDEQSQTPLRRAFHRPGRLALDAGKCEVLAVSARLGRAGQESSQVFANARETIAVWLREKGFAITDASQPVTEETTDGEVVISADGDQLWAVRFDDRRDMRHGAFWRAEITLVNSQPPAIGLRLAQVRQRANAQAPYPAAPRVLDRLAKQVGLSEAGIPFQSAPILVHDHDDAERMVALLANPHRTLPALVISTRGRVASDSSIDDFARRVMAIAHVFVIGANGTAALNRAFGHERSVFGAAMRLYLPGFTADTDPYSQPYRVYQQLPLGPHIVNPMVEDLCTISTAKDTLDERVPTFAAVRQQIGELRVRRALAHTDKIASTAAEERERQEAARQELQASIDRHQETIDEQSAQIQRLKQQLEDSRGELQAIARERDEARDELRQARFQLDQRWLPDAGQEAQATEAVEYPDTWDVLEEWVQIYAPDRLVLLPQAIKAARESAFADVQFAYRVLEFLATHYCALKTRDPNDEQTRINYEKARDELGIEVSRVGTAVEAHRYKSDYRAMYNRREIKLDLHAKKYNGMDPTKIFRVYYSYDEEKNQVIVGWLPSHLTNRQTHAG